MEGDKWADIFLTEGKVGGGDLPGIEMREKGRGEVICQERKIGVKTI